MCIKAKEEPAMPYQWVLSAVLLSRNRMRGAIA